LVDVVTAVAVRPPVGYSWTEESQQLDLHVCRVLHEHIPDRPHNAAGHPLCVACLPGTAWPCQPVITADLNLALIS
jgi:hypothetical protein